MTFEPVITIGTMLHAAALIVTIVIAFMRLDKKVDRIHAEMNARMLVIEARVTDLWESWKANGGRR